MNEQFIDKTDILQKAKDKWDGKSVQDKLKTASKYLHFADKYRIPLNGWEKCFDSLSKRQQNIIVKGELIRVYDALPNTSKTKIMRNLGLTTFASKWFKLPACDKKTLLNYVIT